MTRFPAKRLAVLLIALCALLSLTAPALAAAEGAERMVIGADLTDEQIDTVYTQLGVVRGSVPELTVTNAEERTYLEGVVDEDVIGHNSISCVYICILSPGAGLRVSRAETITWCTEDMYRAALMTAGIYDAQVKVGAPFSVSGTAALTGIYKAYESITGVQLQEQAKSAAADELALTAELAEQGSDTGAVAIVNDMKLLLDETQTMTDDSVRQQLRQIASQYGYSLDDGTADRLVQLCRTLENLSSDELQQRVSQFQSTLASAAQFGQEGSGLGRILGQFLRSIGDFLQNLF